MKAIGDPDQKKGLDRFRYRVLEARRSRYHQYVPRLGPKLDRRAFAPAPDAGAATDYYRQLPCYSAAFALCSDMALLTLGGALKRKKCRSARLGDILSELLPALGGAEALGR